METVSIVLWVVAVAILIITCIPRLYTVPICALGELFGAGGFVSVINEYNAGAIDSSVAVFLAIAMVAIMIFALTRILAGYMSNVKVRI